MTQIEAVRREPAGSDGKLHRPWTSSMFFISGTDSLWRCSSPTDAFFRAEGASVEIPSPPR